ncbi:590_t:CDS:2 [Acaulospora colombiana]|uniref:590_t:CDS:1 n=1 Tax=Acaulospora colombiana TaxID=27376 RepID=A0ACA9KZP4_9GLOM|nr:590_t:CDS:2 [Acaulospora colombiana]
MPTQFSSKLLQDYSQLLDNADDYNVSIQVGEGSNVKEFRAHSNILRARYIYAGILDLEKQSGSDILGLLIASDELLLDELISYCQNHLIEEKANWLRLNIVQVLQTVIKHDRCKKLQDHCLEYICQDPQSFFSSRNFQSLDRDILYGLLSRDDLQFEEIEIWEHLLKWGIAQISVNDKVFTDVTKWSDKNFDALRKFVEPFIPLIRFFEITSKDFYYKVRPYKKIIPRNIYEDVMSYHLASTEPKTPNLTPRMGRWKIDSNIIKSKHAAILANWINRSDSKFGIKKKIPYEFTLLYRGTLHGFKDEVFRGYVNNQGSAIVVIKVRGSGQIIGGYNPCGWIYRCIPNWTSTFDSFIFTFGNGKTNANIKVSHVNNPDYAVYDNANNGAQFGQSDLVIKNAMGTCNLHSYEDSILDTNSFIIEEIEAFKIAEKIDANA